jgi:hypothetical protein
MRKTRSHGSRGGKHWTHLLTLATALAVASTNSLAAAVTPADLTGGERVTGFEGFVPYDSFIIVANAGQKGITTTPCSATRAPPPGSG